MTLTDILIKYSLFINKPLEFVIHTCHQDLYLLCLALRVVDSNEEMFRVMILDIRNEKPDIKTINIKNIIHTDPGSIMDEYTNRLEIGFLLDYIYNNLNIINEIRRQSKSNLIKCDSIDRMYNI